jgi:putative ABC transport system substrate-binding protein
VNRRQFITLLGGVGVAWPVAARAQERERVRRIGVLMPFVAGDPEAQARSTVFAQSLQRLGWTVGRNLQIDYRFSGGDTDRVRQHAAELVALAPV